MKRCIALLMIVVLMSFCACSNNSLASNQNTNINTKTEAETGGEAEAEGYVLGYDDQPFYTTRSSMLVSNGEGYYFFLYNQLFYYDLDTKTCVIACGKPDCEHKNFVLEDEENNCNAFFPSDKFYFEKGFSYFEGSIYLLGKSSKDKYTVSIYKISADGAQREEVCEVCSISDWNDIGEFALHRGYAFFSVRTSDKTAEFKRVNLKNKTVDTICEMQGMGSTFDRMAGNGNYIYFSKIYSEDDTYENWIGMLCRANIESGEVEEVCENLGSFAVLGNSVYFINYKNHDNIYQCNISSKEVTALKETPNHSDMLLTDGKFLYLYVDDEKTDMIVVMSTDGEVLDEIQVPHFYLIQGGGEDCLFIETQDNGLQVFDKSEIGAGVYESDTVFSIKEDKLVLNE